MLCEEVWQNVERGRGSERDGGRKTNLYGGGQKKTL